MGSALGGLIFLIFALITLVNLGRLVYRLVKRKPALRLVTFLAGMWALYAVAIIISGVFSSERLIPLGSIQCFDDWCASVVKATSEGATIVLEVRVINKARRVTQTPDHPKLTIIDTAGSEYMPTEISPRPLDSKLEVGETFITNARFKIKDGQKASKALLVEGTGPPSIGDQNSFLHKKTYFDLKPGI